MNTQEIKQVLEKHRQWLNSEEGGERAYLRGADLQRADLRGADLQRADLRGVDLQGADLQRADLQRADLRGVDLRGADLQGAYLRGVDLRGADLRGAYLQRADLQRADLRGADLQGAYLQRADLQRADLRGADLRGADLQRAYLAPFANCPEEGDFVGWKKLNNGTVAKLLIPAEAKRTSAMIGRKCRAEFVKVLEGDGYDQRTGMLHYSPGEIVRPDGYDDDIRVECTKGIHFFITKQEAIDW